MSLYFAHEREPLTPVAGEEKSGCIRQGPRSTSGSRRIEDLFDLRAGPRVLRRKKPEQWTTPRKHRRTEGDETRRLEQCLGGANGHHTGQRPTRDRERTFQRARAEDHALRTRECRSAAEG